MLTLGSQSGKGLCCHLTGGKDPGPSWLFALGGRGMTQALTGLLTCPATQGQEHHRGQTSPDNNSLLKLLQETTGVKTEHKQCPS